MTSKVNTSKTKSVASIVLAGGQGTRLKPLTTARCKPAVSFAGRFRLIDVPISSSLNSKIDKIYVIAQHLASSLKSHIDTTYENSCKDLTIFSPKETKEGPTWFKGTADAIRKNWQELSQAPVDYFLILSGDQLYNIDFEKMLGFAVEKNADLVIATLAVEEADAKRMGLLKIGKEAEVEDFIEKPQDPFVLKRFAHMEREEEGKTQFLGSMGIYVFKKEVLARLIKEQGDDFGHDLIPIQVKQGKTFAYVYEGYWEDIGTISAFYRANLALTEEGSKHLDLYDAHNPIISISSSLPDPLIRGSKITESVISPGAVIEAKEIHHSVIGMNTEIKPGTVIEDSVILGGQITPSCGVSLHIGENCVIKKAIIDENTFIGSNVRLINQAGLREYDGDGIYIRDGIIVVTSGTKIPEGFTL